MLVAHGYIRERPSPERPGPGRKPSPTYDVNPLWGPTRSHNSQNSHNPADSPDPPVDHADSANCANTANGAAAPEPEPGDDDWGAI